MINGHKIYLVAAVDKKNGLGKKGTLAWRLKKEMAYFTKVTTKTADPEKQNAVIMGSTTWESIPEKYRPLPERKNIVLAFDESYHAPGTTVATSIKDAYQSIDTTIETVFIIGGASIYEQTIDLPETDGMYITKINHDFECDVFFPGISKEYSNITTLGKDEEKGIHFDYCLYEK
ncbi:dihydrofolate reductase [Patescibacteria group bacterium]|nr:dihydrofolate reductase [Patescibacteria group bacterium]